MNRTLILPLMMLAVLGAAANDMDFNYRPAGASVKWWGTAKTETYDVAIRLADPGLVGKQVTGFDVQFRTMNATNLKMWLTTELALEKNEAGVKTCKPNIMSRDVEISGSGLSLILEQPYTLTADGLYLGYTFTVPDAGEFGEQYPVAVYEGSNPNGFFIHATRGYPTWQNKSEALEVISAINVHLSGAVDNSVAIATVERDYTTPGLESQLTAGIVNHGINSISSINYTLNLAGQNTQGTLEFNPAIAPDFNAVTPVQIPVEPVDKPGTYYGTLSLDKVNGADNPDEEARANVELAVASFTPKRLVLMEEYTYFGCGWCPIGWACLEEMNRLYPDFIAVAWHTADQVTTTAPTPNVVAGAPSSVFNRVEYVYPSFLPMDGAEGVENVWKRLMQQPAIADIDVKASWNSSSHEALTATATCRFIADEKNSDYRVAYMVVENGMTDENWEQANYYSGLTQYSNFPLMQQFIDAKNPVKNLVYNDVMVHTPATWGEKGSIPAAFTGGDYISNSVEIKASDIVSRDGLELVMNPDNLFIVAVVTRGDTGEVLNAARCPVTENSAVPDVYTPSENSQARYYDLTGREIACPANGIFIKRVGSSATKVIL